MNILAALLLILIPSFDTMIDGISMQPTIKDGEIVTVYKIKPKVGDIVAANCFSSKCKYIEKTNIVKRLTKKEGDCYYLEGDNQPISFDSNDFGWLCGEEIKFRGVVK